MDKLYVIVWNLSLKRRMRAGSAGRKAAIEGLKWRRVCHQTA